MLYLHCETAHLCVPLVQDHIVQIVQIRTNININKQEGKFMLTSAAA